jgi:serine-type D-Ala-D-Ala carboxypeptidase/endopeptidase
MTLRGAIPMAGFLLVLIGAAVAGQGPAPDADAADPGALLQRWVDDGQGVGAIAVLVRPRGWEVASAGRVAGPGSGPPHPETLFEIGSVTKVFTALLLAEMVDRGEVSLDTPLGALYPIRDRLDPEVASVTLVELATHASGLPRLAMDGPTLRRLVLRPGDPYRGSTREEIFDVVAALDGEALAGRGRFQYSNLGIALLGRLLEQAAGEDYEALLRSRVLEPLGLVSTRPTLEVEDDPRLARPHRENLRPARNWRLDGYLPAGGLASTAEDMARVLQHVIDGEPGFVRRTLELQWRDEDSGTAMGLGWVLGKLDGELMAWHNGRTGGYHAFVGVLPGEETGIVLLTNASRNADALALAALRGEERAPGSEPRILWTVFTLAFLAGAPWLAHSRRRELRQSVRGERAAPRARIHWIVGGLDVALILALAWVLGRWESFPGWLWWVALGLAVVLLASAVRDALRLSWLPPTSPVRRTLPVLEAGATLALTAWVVFSL